MWKRALPLALALTTSALAEAPRHAWASFAPGDSVVLERVDEMSGQEPVLFSQQLTLSEEKEGRVWINVQELEAGGEQGSAYQRELLLWETPESLKLELGSVRDETLEVDGRTLPCEVSVYMGDDLMGRGSIMLELWRTPELTVPVRNLSVDGYEVLLGADVVKVEWELDMGDGQRSSGGVSIARFDRPRTVGDAEVPCLYETGSLLRRLPNALIEGLMQRWLSDEIPGHVVREETTTSFGDRRKTTTLEVVTFERAAARTAEESPDEPRSPPATPPATEDTPDKER